MKVLLYETGEIGHRAVYRDRYKSALEQTGVEVIAYHYPPYEQRHGFNRHLQDLATRHKCDLIHLLTLDDHTRRLFFSSPLSSASRRAVIGTYYLYQNIGHPIKGWAIRRLFIKKKIDALLVPSVMSLLAPEKFQTSANKLFSLPDPDVENRDAPLGKSEALKAISAPEEWTNKTVILICGVLDKRRGVDKIVEMFAKCGSIPVNMAVIFAGRINREALPGKTLDSLMRLVDGGRAKVIDKWLKEEEMECCFSCANLFCIIPIREFQGASSTVSRALKAGLVIVAPKDSVAGRCADAYGRAVLFNRGDADHFARSLQIASGMQSGIACRELLNPCRLPLSVGLDEFGRKLAAIYSKVMASFSASP